MRIKIVKIIEHYEVMIESHEDDPGKYIVERLPLNSLDIRYNIAFDKQWLRRNSRPFINIKKEIEKLKRMEKEQNIERQRRLIGKTRA